MVIFKNLLEDSYDDFAYGIVLKDKRLFCLCGCNGTFEEDEYVIIKNDANPAKDTYLKVKSHKEKNDELLLKKLERFYLETACMREEALDYGYRNSSMSVIKRTTAKQLFDFGVAVYKLYSDDTEAQVEKAEELNDESVLYGVESTFVSNGDKTRLLEFVGMHWQAETMEQECNQYVICMDSNYVRDSQMIDTKAMSQEEFENIDWLSCEMEHNWHDMAPTPFIGVVEAKNEDEALAIAAEKYRYDERCLYVAKEIKHVSQNKDVYTLTVMGILDGEFDLSTRVFDSFDHAQKEFYESIDYEKKHTWISDYRIEQIDENDDSCDENRVLETLYCPDRDSMENITWEAYRDGYCSSMHTIIKLKKQVWEKDDDK